MYHSTCKAFIPDYRPHRAIVTPKRDGTAGGDVLKGVTWATTVQAD